MFLKLIGLERFAVLCQLVEVYIFQSIKRQVVGSKANVLIILAQLQAIIKLLLHILIEYMRTNVHVSIILYIFHPVVRDPF